MKAFRVAAVAVLMAALPAAAVADMIEVKKKGFINGQIITETDLQVTFKDGAGNVATYERDQVLFLEREKTKGVIEAAKQKLSGIRMPKMTLPELPKQPPPKPASTPVAGYTQALAQANDAASAQYKRQREASRELRNAAQNGGAVPEAPAGGSEYLKAKYRRLDEKAQYDQERYTKL